MNIREEELLHQTFIALTARWRKEDRTLAIGVTRSRLKTAGEMADEELDDVLAKLRSRIEMMGLDLVEYLYEGEVWYTVRSSYVCPTELQSEEEAVLAVIMSDIENSENKKVSAEALKKKFVAAKYFSEHQIERIMRNLEELGYIERKNRLIVYSPRTLLEFSEEARRHIAEETRRFGF